MIREPPPNSYWPEVGSAIWEVPVNSHGIILLRPPFVSSWGVPQVLRFECSMNDACLMRMGWFWKSTTQKWSFDNFNLKWKDSAWCLGSQTVPWANNSSWKCIFPASAPVTCGICQRCGSSAKRCKFLYYNCLAAENVVENTSFLILETWFHVISIESGKTKEHRISWMAT